MPEPASQLSRDAQQRIVHALNSANATRPCSRCGAVNFAILDGYVNMPVSLDPGAMPVDGPTIPAAVACCNTCGHLEFHALGPLGIMPD